MAKHTQINGLLSPTLQKLRFKNALPFIKGNYILDIGSSNGEIIKLLSPQIKYFGIEGNKEYFEEATKKYKNHKFLNFYLEHDKVNKIEEFGVNKFDTIIMLAVLEHMKSPEETLKLLRTYLSEQGKIIITTPSSAAEPVLKIGSKIGLFSNEMDEHENHFPKDKLIAMCSRAGYRIVYYKRFELGFNHLIILEKENN
jgi:2-polyprenyl-3-methyl-5-hydroxy-6-metoxy-1,4-benzoquinol methylase